MSPPQIHSDNNSPGEGKDYIEFLSRFFENMGAWSFDNRWWVVGFCVVSFLLSGFLGSPFRVDISFEAFFDRDDPTYGAYLKYRDDFGSDEVSYLVYRAPDDVHGPWDIEVMQKIAKLTEALEDEVPFVSEVTSLTNVEFMEGVPDGIDIYDLLDDFPETQEELLVIRNKVMRKPTYIGGLINQDADIGAVIIEMELSSTDPPEALRVDPELGDRLDNVYPQVSYYAIEKILERPEYEGIEFFHAGDVPLNSTYNIILLERELPLIMSLSIIIIGLLLAIIFRRVVGVAGPLLVVMFAVAASVAVIGINGWSIDFMFGLLPTLIIAVGVADSVHILAEFDVAYAKLGDRREALKKTLYLVGPPCLLTSLTTAAGFLSLSISPVKTVAHLAVYSAVGVLAAFIGSVTILSACLSFGSRTPEGSSRELEPGAAERKLAKRKGSPRLRAMLLSVARFDIKYRNAILVVSAVIFIAAGFGIGKLTVDSNFLTEFSEKVPIRQVTAYVDEAMGGTTGVVYLFDTGEADGILDPAVLREIERVQDLAIAHGDVVKKTYSIVDILKDLNMSFHEGDPAYYVLPESRELIAQYMLIYESSGGEETEEYVSGDFSRASLEIRCKLAETSRYAALVEKIDAHLEANPLQGSTVSLTGVGALWIKFVEYITWSQIRGVLIAFSVICVMMCFIFRSFKIGLLSMVPNIAPVVLCIGGMGWLGIHLDYMRLLIAPIAIGIAVDDTIHLITRFHREFLRCGKYEEALYAAMEDVGRALFVTSAILIAGFLINCISTMDSQVSFGALLSMTIFVALIADFFLMPAMVLALKPFGPERD